MTEAALLPPPTMPVVGDGMGAVVANSGRHLRNAIVTAFDMIGGVAALADWAQTNRTDFYTKLMPKVIPKEVLVDDRRSVDDLILELDGTPLPPRRAENVVDGEFEDVQDYD